MPGTGGYWAVVAGPDSEAADQIASAFNHTQVALLETALLAHPELRSIKLGWKRPSRRPPPIEPLTLGEAAVHLGWAAPLPVLWLAGERFQTTQKPESLLTQATRGGRGACVEALLHLGMDPNGTPGAAPLAALAFTREGAMAHVKRNARIVRAFIKAGVDPLAATSKNSGLTTEDKQSRRNFTVVEALLAVGNVSTGVLLLAEVDRKKPTLNPLLFDGKVFWAAVESGALFYSHQGAGWKKTWKTVRVDYQRLLELALHLNLAPPRQLVATLGMMAAFGLRGNDGLPLHDRAAGLAIASSMAKLVASNWPKERKMIESFTNALIDYGEELPAGDASYWAQQKLERSTHAPKGVRKSVRL